MLTAFRNFMTELKMYLNFFDENQKNSRILIFYSESAIYYKYYEGFIDYIIKNSNINIKYVTSDINDPILKISSPRISCMYIKNLLQAFISKLDNAVLVMTMPDLNVQYIKKSKYNVENVYLFHAVVSTHLQYNEKSFDNYETIFCVGKHHKNEICKRESLFDLPQKTLIEVGYPLIEQINQEYLAYLASNRDLEDTQKTTILIAPTWGEQCILDNCIYEMLDKLKKTKYLTIIRPHPEFIKRNPEKITRLKKHVQKLANISLELNMMAKKSLYAADVLITDRSGMAFEYALGTGRPVLFIETPYKIHNPNYEKLMLDPVENSCRNKLGACLEFDQVHKIQETIESLLSRTEAYTKIISEIRHELLYNWSNSAQIGAEHLIKSVISNNS